MPKKKKHHHAPTYSPAQLEARARRAAGEGRSQQALELAKQLHKQEPTPAHLELLKDAYLGRARQLRAQGYTRDAATVLGAAQALDTANPAWLEQLAVELARSGEPGQALLLLERVPGSPAADRVRGHAADAALLREAAGRDTLPAALHADFDRILTAFRQVEAGQDDAARETLQGIGLRSPFLEWKLLLRGLQAYYHNDDVRAVENWSRLDADRVPARLAAPFRTAIDAAYRAAQPHETQAALQRQLNQVQSSPLMARLRALRESLANRESLAPAFRQAELLLPDLRQQAPQLVPRLAHCLYAIILETGPDDVLRYQRVFGAPADDPHFNRLRAIAHERGGDLVAAHKYWQKYEEEIAAQPALWPGEQAVRARALIWRHMAENAARIPSPAQMARLPAFLRDHPDRPRPLSPSVEECFERSLELAPDQVETYAALFHHYRDEKKDAKAEKVAQRLLQRFPDHVTTLEEFGDLCLKREKYAEGLDLLQRALAHNPLDRGLRQKVATAHLYDARSHAEGGRFAEARRGYQAALELADSERTGFILCRWAACEFKAGDAAHAEELMQKARDRGTPPLAVAYVMLTETVRLKLPRPLKTRFDREFKEGLAAPPTAVAASALAEFTASLAAGGITYHGQKTHAKQVLTYLDKAANEDFTARQLRGVCEAMLILESVRRARRFTDLGRELFPKDPIFPYLQANSFALGKPIEQAPYWQITPLLQEAERLARAIPPDEEQQVLLRDIQRRLQALEALNPFGRMMDDFFDRFGPGYEDEDDFYDDDEDDDDFF